MNAAAARQALTSQSTISVGLLLTIVAVVFYAGVSWHTIVANAADNERQDKAINDITHLVTRGLTTIEQNNVTLDRQEDDLDKIQDGQVDNRQELRLLQQKVDALIRALEREGSSVGGMPP